MTTKKSVFAKQGSTIILRGAVVFIGLIVLTLCIFALPQGIASTNVGEYRPILLGMYLPAIPFFFALHQTLKLLGYIDKNKAFSRASVLAIRNIKYCAATISALYAAGLPYIYYVADKDDAPGVVALGCAVVFVSFIIATATAVLQKLVQHAVDIKSENDLTV